MGERNHKGLGAGESIATVAAGAGVSCRLEKLLICLVPDGFWERGAKGGRDGIQLVAMGKERPPVPLISAARVLETQLCLECC